MIAFVWGKHRNDGVPASLPVVLPWLIREFRITGAQTALYANLWGLPRPRSVISTAGAGSARRSRSVNELGLVEAIGLGL